MGWFATLFDTASRVVSDVDLTDVVISAAIGAGTAALTDQNVAAGAAVGGIAGGATSGTKYDVSDFLTGKQGIKAETYWDAMGQGDQQDKSLLDKAVGWYGEKDKGGKLTASLISGAAGAYSRKKEREEEREYPERLLDKEREGRQIKIGQSRLPTPKGGRSPKQLNESWRSIYR